MAQSQTRHQIHDIGFKFNSNFGSNPPSNLILVLILVDGGGFEPWLIKVGSDFDIELDIE